MAGTYHHSLRGAEEPNTTRPNLNTWMSALNNAWICFIYKATYVYKHYVFTIFSGTIIGKAGNNFYDPLFSNICSSTHLFYTQIKTTNYRQIKFMSWKKISKISIIIMTNDYEEYNHHHFHYK